MCRALMPSGGCMSYSSSWVESGGASLVCSTDSITHTTTPCSEEFGVVSFPCIMVHDGGSLYSSVVQLVMLYWRVSCSDPVWGGAVRRWKGEMNFLFKTRSERWWFSCHSLWTVLVGCLGALVSLGGGEMALFILLSFCLILEVHPQSESGWSACWFSLLHCL